MWGKKEVSEEIPGEAEGKVGNPQSDQESNSPGSPNPEIESRIKDFEGGGGDSEVPPSQSFEEQEKLRKKAEFLTRMFLGAYCFCNNQIARVRGEHWKTTPEELTKVEDAATPLGYQYAEKVALPWWLDRFQGELSLAWVIATIAWAKFEVDQEIQAQKETEGHEVSG